MLRVYAQSATASVPIIGASRSAPVADCPPLSRPHNLHYVGMPAAQGNLARLPLREFFDRDGRYEKQRPNKPRSRSSAL
jgi:hypothetical protein